MKNLSLFFCKSIIFILLISFICISKPAHAIKIGLLTNAQNAKIAVSKKSNIIDAYTNRALLSLKPMQLYYFSKKANYINVTNYGNTYKLNSTKIYIKPDYENSFIYGKNKWYRGNFILLNTASGINLINDLSLENYIMGVVPSEMPSSWNTEAHKAQAIAARSYAIANLGKRAKHGYDLKDTPEDQAYGGASSETIKTNSAVLGTKGLVLVCQNKIIPAYYHSSSGGYTVNSGDVWVKNLPFIKAVPSLDGNLPKNGHGVGMSQHGANKLGNLGYNVYQILGYFYKNVGIYRLNREF